MIKLRQFQTKISDTCFERFWDGLNEYLEKSEMVYITDIGNWTMIITDNDGKIVIPINEENYFADDISEKFTQFIKNAFGEEHIIENQNYICGLLNGDNYGDAIRRFFVNVFYKYHVAMYSGTVGKRSIYWMFDSGKQGGFKCLINIHRYSPDTVGIIRSDYLTKA